MKRLFPVIGIGLATGFVAIILFGTVPTRSQTSTAHTIPAAERVFNLQLTYSELVNLIWAVKYNTALTADAANRLSDKLNAQAADSTLNPTPKPVNTPPVKNPPKH